MFIINTLHLFAQIYSALISCANCQIIEGNSQHSNAFQSYTSNTFSIIIVYQLFIIELVPKVFRYIIDQYRILFI